MHSARQPSHFKSRVSLQRSNSAHPGPLRASAATGRGGRCGSPPTGGEADATSAGSPATEERDAARGSATPCAGRRRARAHRGDGRRAAPPAAGRRLAAARRGQARCAAAAAAPQHLLRRRQLPHARRRVGGERHRRAPRAAASGTVPEHPVIFSKVPDCVIATGEPIRIPERASQAIDYEAELAVVIGKGGRASPPRARWTHVCGYTIFNDVTARDVQRRHKQWLLGKSLDTFGPMGPWLVTADELDGATRASRCWVNGELRQDARTRDLIFDIPALIETISAGRVARARRRHRHRHARRASGIGFNPPKYLKRGDRCASRSTASACWRTRSTRPMTTRFVERMAVEIDGDGDAVLMMHGLGGASNTWTPRACRRSRAASAAPRPARLGALGPRRGAAVDRAVRAGGAARASAGRRRARARRRALDGHDRRAAPRRAAPSRRAQPRAVRPAARAAGRRRARGIRARGAEGAQRRRGGHAGDRRRAGRRRRRRPTTKAKRPAAVASCASR